MAHYYIYRIAAGATGLVKQLEMVDRFETYRDAKSRIKGLRMDQSTEDTASYKIIFADSELDAEEKLSEKRQAPVMQEWEK